MAEIGITRKRHRRGRPRVRPDGETRKALQEADKSSDVAGTSFASAVRRTGVALADRLRVQQAGGLIALDDGDGAAGRLLGMVASAARRHLRRPVYAGRVRKSKRGSAPVQRYFYGAAKCKEFKEFAAAEAALARGKVGFYPPHAR
jgi:hypothetical protein